jgi:site-specific DNA-cytosine methylase
MNQQQPVDVEIRHFHLFCGLGGGAKGFNRGRAQVKNLRGRFRCIGGIDIVPAAIRDFDRAAGAPGSVVDLFSLEQFRAFPGRDPAPGWREATPDDIRRAAGNERPHIVFLSAPCKGFSGLLPEKSSATAKYQALNGLTLRGVWLMLEAWKDDPVELIVFENVPRIATRGRHLLDQIIALLRSYCYAVAETTHDCGELGGLGQSRKRFLLVARHQAKVPPFLHEPVKRRLRGVGEILEQLPLPGDARGGPMHRMPALQWKTWVRLAFVEAGSDWRSLNKLNVEGGVLRDFGIQPEIDYHHGAYGVHRWSDTAGVVSSRSGPTNGAFAVADPHVPDGSADFKGMRVVRWRGAAGAVTTQRSPGSSAQSVADPRVDGHPKSVQLGVRRWRDTAAVVKGDVSVGTGPYAVADPNLQGKPRFNNTFRIVRWRGAAPAIAGPGGPGGGLAVADPRPPERDDYKQTKYRVTKMEEASGAVIGASTTGNGAFAVADPVFEGREGATTFGVKEWRQPSGLVAGESYPSNGAYAVADPRTGFGENSHRNKLKVVAYRASAGTITGADRVGSGALSVADPRPVGLNAKREAYQTGGHYGVVRWRDSAYSVPGFAKYDRGHWSVADHRHFEPTPLTELPAPDDRLVAVIRALDDTWHRPFTTLELAALQSLVDPNEVGETFAFDGASDSAWRERIGNAVPPAAAEAIASVMGTTLLLAWSGETFVLSSTPIWVRPLALALAVDHSPNDAIFRGDA